MAEKDRGGNIAHEIGDFRVRLVGVKVGKTHPMGWGSLYELK